MYLKTSQLENGGAVFEPKQPGPGSLGTQEGFLEEETSKLGFDC